MRLEELRLKAGNCTVCDDKAKVERDLPDIDAWGMNLATIT